MFYSPCNCGDYEPRDVCTNWNDDWGYGFPEHRKEYVTVCEHCGRHPPIACECCGSKEDLTISTESVGGYIEKLPVFHCGECGFSYYQEPEEK